MSKLTLREANAICDAALAHARGQGFAPMTVAVLDAGGHQLSFQREDKAGILRPQIAIGKAWGALGMGFGTRGLITRAQHFPTFIGAIAAASDGRVIPTAGGVLIERDGETIGAVGVSGDGQDEDESCALTAIAAVGLTGRGGE